MASAEILRQHVCDAVDHSLCADTGVSQLCGLRQDHTKIRCTCRIPNIPFFYVTYRCWSHWRALRGSDHLEFIVENRLFQQESPKQIEDLYDKIAPDLDYTFVTRSQVMNGSAAKEEVILTAGSHTQISKALQVPEISGEVERAVWQVENALKKEEKEAAIAAEEVKKRDEEAQQAEKESK